MAAAQLSGPPEPWPRGWGWSAGEGRAWPLTGRPDAAPDAGRRGGVWLAARVGAGVAGAGLGALAVLLVGAAGHASAGRALPLLGGLGGLLLWWAITGHGL